VCGLRSASRPGCAPLRAQAALPGPCPGPGARRPGLDPSRPNRPVAARRAGLRQEGLAAKASAGRLRLPLVAGSTRLDVRTSSTGETDATNLRESLKIAEGSPLRSLDRRDREWGAPLSDSDDRRPPSRARYLLTCMASRKSHGESFPGGHRMRTQVEALPAELFSAKGRCGRRDLLVVDDARSRACAPSSFAWQLPKNARSNGECFRAGRAVAADRGLLSGAETSKVVGSRALVRAARGEQEPLAHVTSRGDPAERRPLLGA
jgi:hypothetical protein